MNDSDNKRGFSGLSELRSVVPEVNKLEKSEQKKETKPTPSKSPSQPHWERTSLNSKTDRATPTVEATGSDTTTSHPLIPMILLVIGTVLVVWIIYNAGEQHRTTASKNTQNTGLYNPSPNNISEIPGAEKNGGSPEHLANIDTLATPQEYGYTLSESTQSNTAQNSLQDTGLRYERPSVGSNNILDVPQIRWCIREGIRIDAIRDVGDSNQGIEKFNLIVDDYNSRCGSYRYRQGSLAEARRNVEPFRSQIVAKAIVEARQFGSSYKPLSPSVSSSRLTAETPDAQYTREAQKLLTDLGYEPGPIDGDYGRRTALAVIAFQKAQGLAVDGVVDKNLIEKLRLGINEQTDTLVLRAKATSNLTVKDANRYSEANRFGIIGTCKQQGSAEYVDNCQEEESNNLNLIEANTQELAAEEVTMLAQGQQLELVRLRTIYFNSIRQRVERNWHKPAGLVGLVNCVVSILQSPVGEVLTVKVNECYNNNAALRKSVESAVWAASPLPVPPDPKLFDRRVRFFFKPG